VFFITISITGMLANNPRFMLFSLWLIISLLYCDIRPTSHFTTNTNVDRGRNRQQQHQQYTAAAAAVTMVTTDAGSARSP